MTRRKMQKSAELMMMKMIVLYSNTVMKKMRVTLIAWLKLLSETLIIL
jgi:hypothetical protein